MGDFSGQRVLKGAGVGVRWEIEDLARFLVAAEGRAGIDSLLQYSCFPCCDKVSMVPEPYRQSVC